MREIKGLIVTETITTSIQMFIFSLDSSSNPQLFFIPHQGAAGTTLRIPVLDEGIQAYRQAAPTPIFSLSKHNRRTK